MDGFGFHPADDIQAFRRALGSFSTGVTIVTTVTPDGPTGITANSFASVSLDPPLVLWCPAKVSRRFEIFASAERYAIHVVAESQAELAYEFSRWPGAFQSTRWREGQHGLPILDGVASVFICKRTARYDAGDHAIVVGEVTHAIAQGVPPLIFSRGNYGGFAPPAD